MRKRIDYGVYHSGRRADRPDFAAALMPSGLCVHCVMCVLDFHHRDIVRTRHAIVHERAGQQLPGLFVVDAIFEQRLPDALHDTAVIWPSTIIGLITVPTSSTAM
jgi:hypothetical protein